MGSEEQWEQIEIYDDNAPLLNAQIVYNYCEHVYVQDEATPSTCTEHGYTKYTCQDCGHSYADYTSNPTGHTFNDEGVCEGCGEKEVSTSYINTQMLSVESVLAMVRSLLAKLFGIFTVA